MLGLNTSRWWELILFSTRRLDEQHLLVGWKPLRQLQKYWHIRHFWNQWGLGWLHGNKSRLQILVRSLSKLLRGKLLRFRSIWKRRLLGIPIILRPLPDNWVSGGSEPSSWGKRYYCFLLINSNDRHRSCFLDWPGRFYTCWSWLAGR